MSKKKLGKLVEEGTQIDYDERREEVQKKFKLRQNLQNFTFTSSYNDNDSNSSLESLKTKYDT